LPDEKGRRMYIEVKSDKSIDEAGKALEKAGRKRKFAVVHVHDFCDELIGKEKLFDRELRVYEICHQYSCRKILYTNVKMSTLLPIKICIFKEGEDTIISTINPEVLLRIFKEPTLVNLFKEFTEVIEEIIKEAA
jgi:uncharacterized protein (DUF302 family)